MPSHDHVCPVCLSGFDCDEDDADITAKMCPTCEKLYREPEEFSLVEFEDEGENDA